MINGFFIWDKVSNINGNKASVVLDSDESFKDNTVVFFTNNNKPVVHALVENLRVELNMLDQTDEEVCQLKLNKLIEESKNQEKEQITLEEQANKISNLQAENEKLQNGLKAILAGDMQSLAYLLYPEDFNNVTTIPEL